MWPISRPSLPWPLTSASSCRALLPPPGVSQGDVDEREGDDLFRRFEKEDGGRRRGVIDYSGFLQLLGFDAKAAASRSQKHRDDGEEVDALVRRIRTKLEVGGLSNPYLRPSLIPI